MAESGYHAILYFTTSGLIVGEIPMVDVPSWLQQINNDGSWSIRTQVGEVDEDGEQTSSLLTKDQLWPILVDSWRYSIAIVWGTERSGYICQAGPLISWQQTKDDPAVVEIGGSGLWALLRATLQAAAAWPGTSIADGSGDITFTGTMQYIAQQVLANAIGPAGRNPLPVTIVTNPGGTGSMSYSVSDFASSGQCLQDLTQLDGGPDVLLKPAFADASHIEHLGLVGDPQLADTGNPLVFDYGSSASSILPSGDGSKMATTSYAIGNGSGNTKLWATAADDTLPDGGWPMLESVDTVALDDPVALQAKATADQTLGGRQTRTWSVSVLIDNPSNPFGTYDAGSSADYNVIRHKLLPDGVYTSRILGLQNSNDAVTIQHIIEAPS